MLIRFSKNPFIAAVGVIFYHKINISIFIVISFVAWLSHDYYLISLVSLPVLPVSILGGALAIFLAFRNNAAYDRWWEARKIWGGIVNNSRSFGMEVTTFFGLKGNENLGIEKISSLKKGLVYTHIAWLYSLSNSLRRVDKPVDYEGYLSEKEREDLVGIKNVPQMMIQFQGRKIKDALDEKIITDFQHNEINRVLTELYNLQGAAERIKNTVFPFYYNFFTRVFLWIFIIILPFTLVQSMDIGAIPISLAISFVFYILDQSGEVTEDPFENRAADTPISTICRNIEIDLLQQLGEENLPSPIQVEITKFGGLFIR
jgi:ion channel-forming bestrophin family protein